MRSYNKYSRTYGILWGDTAFTTTSSSPYILIPSMNIHSTTHTARFVNDNITVSEEADVRLTLSDEKDTDESSIVLCPGETKRNFTGKILCVGPYEMYCERPWQLSEDVEFDANKDVTVTDESE
jgi:hypothetical protein